MKKCRSCMKKIDEKAKKCSYCQTDQRDWIARHPILTTLLVIITSPLWIAILVGIFMGSSGSSSSNDDLPERKTDFNVTVNFTGTEFLIKNVDEFDCQNSMMSINNDYELNGYILKHGEEYTFPAGEFTKSGGMRFNPFTTKPQTFSIGCRGDNELRTAIWTGEF